MTSRDVLYYIVLYNALSILLHIYIYIHIQYIYIYIYIIHYIILYTTNSCTSTRLCFVMMSCDVALHRTWLRSISEISSCFFGPRPWHIEIRHRVKKTSTINLFGFETLKLTIRRLKLWKPTVCYFRGS